MTQEQDPKPYPARTNAFATLRDKIYLHRFPSYGNKIFYGLGFLALTCLVLLAATGTTLAFMGQNWWLHSPWGIYFRSVHLWSVQAFIAILVLHVLVGFTTKAYRAPRRMVWVFGATIFCLALIQTEFGYGLRGDFASQYRAVSGADFWNGAHLGYWLNPLNYTQSMAIHIAIIPLAILLLFVLHYLLEHTYGISRPWRKDVAYRMATANHRIMYLRGGVLVAAILTLAFFFHSPYVAPVRIADVAKQNPSLVAQTLVQEFDHTSDTATYFDSIDPYTFDTREIFIGYPYTQYVLDRQTDNAWTMFQNESSSTQSDQIADAEAFVNATGTPSVATSTNPVIAIVGTLMPLTRSGMYESLLNSENPSENYTYSLRFLNDMGVLDAKAASLNMDTEQWGMTKDDAGTVLSLPPGSWWLIPLGAVNTLFNLLNNDYGDQIAGEILGTLMLLFIAFPYIPYVNRLPELFSPIARAIWKDEEAPPARSSGNPSDT